MMVVVVEEVVVVVVVAVIKGRPVSSKQRDPNPNNNSLKENNAANVKCNPLYVDVSILHILREEKETSTYKGFHSTLAALFYEGVILRVSAPLLLFLPRHHRQG